MPLSDIGEPGVSFSGLATIAGHPFTIRGGNTSGKWQIGAQLEGNISLTQLVDSFLGSSETSTRLPSIFPQFTISELAFHFDPESGDYRAHGATQAANFQFFGTPINNAKFSLDFASNQGSRQLSLQTRIAEPSFDTQLELRIASGSSAIHLPANQYTVFVERKATNNGQNILALVRPGTGSIFKDTEFVWATQAWTSISIRPDRTHVVGFTVQTTLSVRNTALGRVSQLPEDLKIHLDATELRVDFGGSPCDSWRAGASYCHFRIKSRPRV